MPHRQVFKTLAMATTSLEVSGLNAALLTSRPGLVL